MCEYKAAHCVICHAYIEPVISYHINIINIYIVTKNQYIYINAEAHFHIHIQCYESSRIISENDVEILYLGSYGVLARWAKNKKLLPTVFVLLSSPFRHLRMCDIAWWLLEKPVTHIGH